MKWNTSGREVEELKTKKWIHSEFCTLKLTITLIYILGSFEDLKMAEE